MSGDPHLAPDSRDDTVTVNEEGGPVNPHIFAAVHRFFDPGAEGLAGGAGLVGRKPHLEAIFVDELRMLRRAVLGDADDPGRFFTADFFTVPLPRTFIVRVDLGL